MSERDPWDWLLGKTPAGAWRHVPYKANQLGQGQDPGQEPRVEVIRRLIAYPEATFRAVVESAQAADRPDRPLRWCCYRDPGTTPARPYWLCILSEKGGGRRFHLGLELFDRARLGLWFFSGFAPSACPSELMAPFPARPEVALPRLELSNDQIGKSPAERWIVEALEDQLRFVKDPTLVPAGEALIPPTSTGMISESILGIPEAAAQGPLGLRNARARLVSELPNEEGRTVVTLHPLGRLSNTIGRDPRSNIVLNDPNISHEHCKIVWRNGEPGLEELGSKNGTTVNDVPVEKGTPVVLPPEAKIELGGVPCLFVRDVPHTPGKDPPRHEARVKKLVAAGKVSKEEEQQIYVEARGRGITPGEVLLDRGKITLAEWYAKPGGGCGLGVLLFFFLLLLTGCHSAGFPPLYEHELDPTPMREGTRRVEWDTDIGLKPVFQARVKERPARVEAHVLFPLGLWEATPERSILRLYPFFQHIERVDPDGFEDTDTILFPFVFTGSHPVEGGYFYLFPFGGTLRGLLGKDEAAGVLFPLYGWTRDRDTETHHVLWPLISWTSGGGSSGFRFLPFIGHQEKRNEEGDLVFNRWTVLWPFFSWADDGTNSKNRFQSMFVFPFYGQTRSAWMDDNTVLWPLFRWWHDKRTGYEEYRFPFPFLIWGEGPDHERFDVWPFFGFRERGDYKRHFFLWPIERYEYQETEEYRDARLWILPLFWTHHRIYKDGSGEDIETTFLPFVRYESRRDGFEEISVLHPLWFTDPLLNFDTILAPFWTLFRWTRDAEGYEHLNLLFGLYSSRETPQGEHRWDILGGLIGHTENPGGDPDAEGLTRLFWFLEF